MNDRVLKVLIVDDECNTRNLVQMSVNWTELGMQNVGEATSGLEAIYMVENLLPDIIITDIQMPYMDGLSLSKAVKERYPDIHIIILTAHDDFSYAQSAVSIGVSDFILKPIDKSVLNETLYNIADKIKSHEIRLNQLELSHQYLKNNITVFQSNFLNELLSNSPAISFEAGELKMLELDFDTEFDTYQIALINILIKKKQYTNIEKQVILQNCCTYIKNTYALSGKLYAFTDIYSNIVLLNNDRSIFFSDVAEHAAAYFKQQFSTIVYCGIGMPTHGIRGITNSYKQALNAIKTCYITGEEVTFADTQVSEPDRNYLNINSLSDNMKLAIRSGSTNQAVDFTKELLQSYVKENINDLDSVKIFALNISTYIKELLNEMNISYIGDLSPSGEMMLQIFKYDKYSDIETTVISIVYKACKIISEALSSKSISIVLQIKNFIDENFSNYELNLKAVAEKFYLNSSYLSRLFKKGTGVSFSEYLINIRIEKAVAMLKIHDYKAYQLAQVVGIPDPNYFVKCFKKVTGTPFAEYKLKIINNP
jgi:two-component system response regulator YesN